jgi:hypothetical protein
VPTDHGRLTVGVAVNVVYALLSLLVGLLAVKLYRDHAKTRRAVLSQNRPDPRDVELVAHDLELETVRFAKQVLSVVLLWAPLVMTPVLADWPDRPVFELMRAGVFLFMLGLAFNSYRAITFRHSFRRRWGSGPRPVVSDCGATSRCPTK